jgi:hypothetical protein
MKEDGMGGAYNIYEKEESIYKILVESEDTTVKT